MSVKVRHYNESILHVTSGLANKEQVEACFAASFNQIRKAYPDDGYEKAHFIINVVADIKGNLFGYSYAWVSDARIYNMLIGRNPEGTERVKQYEDPKWIPPPERRPLMPLKPGQSWAEVTDEEEELDEKYNAPLITEVLPPIVRLPGYKYNAEQLVHAEKIVKHHNPEAPTPTIGYYEVSRAWVTPLDKETDTRALCCRSAPKWVTEDMIKPLFERFSTDKEIRFGKVNGKKQNYTYPVITIIANKNSRFNVNFIYINFSPHCPFDASFSLVMNRKVLLEREDKKAIMIFDHWYESPDKATIYGKEKYKPEITNIIVQNRPGEAVIGAIKQLPPINSWVKPPKIP